MNDFSQLFSELTKNFKDLSRRIAKFETWEPNSVTEIGCGVYLASNQVIPADTWGTINYDTTLWDTSSFYSGGVFTFPYTGRYLTISTTSIFFYAGTLYTRWEFGTTSLQTRGNFDTAFDPYRISQIYSVSAGETMEVQAFRVGAAVTISGSSTYPYSYSQTSIQLLSKG